MNKKLIAILYLALLTGPVAAEQIQSTTGVNTTFRQCIEGVTACDSISEAKLNSFDGLPGDSEAQASQEDPVYGASSSHAKLKDAKGNAQMSATVSSKPGARNGGNSFFLQRYTNTSNHAEQLTLVATLTFDQTVPEENSVFTEDSSAQSFALAELEIFSLGADAIEAGTTAEDNYFIFQKELPPDVIFQSLGNASARGGNNVTGAGSEAPTVTTLIPPGESVWLLAVCISTHADSFRCSSDPAFWSGSESIPSRLSRYRTIARQGARTAGDTS